MKACALLTALVSTTAWIAVLAAAPHAQPISTRVPTGFVPNLGQWRASTPFIGSVGGLSVRLQQDGWTIVHSRIVHDNQGALEPTLPTRIVGEAVSFQFVDGSAETRLVPESSLPGLHHFLLGNDPQAWVRNVPSFTGVRYEGVYPGIDIRVRDAGGLLEYDVYVEPGVDASACVIACEGQRSLSINDAGWLELATESGVLRQAPPTTWEVLPDGSTRPIACRYDVRGVDRYGFVVAQRGSHHGLFIDPVVEWATYLGGSDSDGGGRVTMLPGGDFVVAHHTTSFDYPITPGAFDEQFAGGIGPDIGVARLTADGSSLVYATYMGGSGTDALHGLMAGPDGTVNVVGVTNSSDFPVTPGAFDTTINGVSSTGGDIFIAKLTPDGSDLVFATFLGGEKGETPYDMNLAPNGTIVLTGSTGSFEFPGTPGSYKPVKTNSIEGFVSGVTPDGSTLAYSTFISGSEFFYATFLAAVDVAADGSLLVAGRTDAADFPTTAGALEPTSLAFNGAGAVFLRFSADASELLYASYFGTESTSVSAVTQIQETPDGAILLGGNIANGTLVATEGSFQPQFKGADICLVRVSAAGDEILKSTYLGGSSIEYLNDLTQDAAGRIYVGGQTFSSDFPLTPNAFDTVNAACADGFVAVLDADLSTLRYGSYIGDAPTSDCTDVVSVIPDGCGGLALTVDSARAGWPTTPGAFDTTYNGFGDEWIARLDVLVPWSTVPGGVAGTQGAPLLSGTGSPTVGDSIVLQLRHALPLAPAWLVLGASEIDAPFKAGVMVPSPDVIVGPIRTSSAGGLALPIVWAGGLPSGFVLPMQIWIADPAAPAGYAGSNGLLLEVF